MFYLQFVSLDLFNIIKYYKYNYIKIYFENIGYFNIE